MTFCWYKFGFGTSSWSNHWADHHQLSYTIHFSSHVTIQLRNGSLLLHGIRDDTSQWQFFFLTCNQLMSYPLTKLFLLSNLLQMPNDHGMVDVELLGNFLCCCNRISFDDCSQLVVVNFRWGPLRSSSSRLLSSLQNFRNYHWTVPLLAVPGPNALLLLWVVSTALWCFLNLNKKIAWIGFLSNIVSLA